MRAFMFSRSLQRIIIPNAVKAIRDRTFNSSGLTTATLGDGLEEIGMRAFNYCTLLQHIDMKF